MQRAQMLGFDLGSLGQTAAQRRHDLDAFDRIDAQIAIESHIEIEHLGGIAGFVGNHTQYRLRHGVGGGDGRGRRSGNRARHRGIYGGGRRGSNDRGNRRPIQRAGSIAGRGRHRRGFHGGQPQQFTALDQERFHGAPRGLLGFQELAMQLRGLLLQFLQGEYPLVGGLHGGRQISRRPDGSHRRGRGGLIKRLGR